MQQPFYIVFVAVYFLQQSKHAGQMLRVDVIKQQHHHGETHGKGAGVLKIRLQKFPHRLRMRAGQLQSAAKAVAHRPIIYFGTKAAVRARTSCGGAQIAPMTIPCSMTSSNEPSPAVSR